MISELFFIIKKKNEPGYAPKMYITMVYNFIQLN